MNVCTFVEVKQQLVFPQVYHASTTYTDLDTNE